MARASLLVAIAALAAIGCSPQDHVVVTPNGPPNTFFATWEIDSLRFGPLDCESTSATTMSMDLLDVDTGARAIFAFPCAAYNGTSGLVGPGRFDILLDLLDIRGHLIDQIDAGVQPVSALGSVDLGHFVFQVP